MNTQTKAERIAYWIVFITTIAAGAFAVAYITLLTGCASSGQRQLAASGADKLETVNAYLRASAPSPTPAPISQIEEFERHRSTNNPALGEGIRLGYGLAPAPVFSQLTASAIVAPPTNIPPRHWLHLTWNGSLPDAVEISTNRGAAWMPGVVTRITSNGITNWLVLTNIPVLPVAVRLGLGGSYSSAVLFRGNYSIVTVTNHSQSSDDLAQWKTYARARVYNQTNTTGRQFFRAKQDIYWDTKPTYVITEALP